MNLAIDCRALRATPSGIPNFLVSAINGIAQQNPTWHLFLLANDQFNEELNDKLIYRDNIHIIITPLKLMPNYAIIWYLLKTKSVVEKLDIDLFWAPAFLLPPNLPTKVKTLVTVHDMVFKQFKNTMSFINRSLFELLHDRSINKADLLWANSDYTKKGIEAFFPDRKCKTVFTGFFINTTIFKRTSLTPVKKQELMAKYNLAGKFIIFVGTLEPRKNLSFLLSLMPELATSGFNLLVIGAKGWGETSIKDVITAPGYPENNVTFAGFVSSEDLVKLYAIASVYVSTSLNEGFGMPQLEAMACGCPVISPHNSAMIEVVAGAGETVKSWNKEDWIQTIQKVCSNPNGYIQAGFDRVRSYERQAVLQRLTDYIQSQEHISRI